jgi:hypothetical protein
MMILGFAGIGFMPTAAGAVMATDRQIAANRANALRSTGPKTAVGLARSSRNAVRHGFSCPFPSDPVTLATVDALAQVLAGKEAVEDAMSGAEFAEAHLELLRIRSTRTALISKIDFVNCDTHKLRRLVALDRYERYAHTKRRRASAKL